MTRHLADKWLRKAEELAGLPPLKGKLWHAYRGKWATERKHMSPVDVAAAGGCANPYTLQLVYQQADEETLLEVVVGGGKLREAKYAFIFPNMRSYMHNVAIGELKDTR